MSDMLSFTLDDCILDLLLYYFELLLVGNNFGSLKDPKLLWLDLWSGMLWPHS